MYCSAESYTLENYKDNSKPVVAGNLRLLLGLAMIFAGLYIAVLSNVQGHGLGFLIVFAAPLIILKDDK